MNSRGRASHRDCPQAQRVHEGFMKTWKEIAGHDHVSYQHIFFLFFLHMLAMYISEQHFHCLLKSSRCVLLACGRFGFGLCAMKRNYSVSAHRGILDNIVRSSLTKGGLHQYVGFFSGVNEHF